MAEIRGKENKSVDAFELKNHYGADSLFARFMSDKLPHSVTLQNNWGDIRTHDVEPITRLNVTLKCDFVPSEEKGRLPESKYAIFQARADVRVGSGFLSVRKLQQALEDQGIDTDYVNKKRSDKKGPNGYFLVSTNPDIPLTIQLFDMDSSIYTFQLRYPGKTEAVEDVKEFSKLQSSFFETLKKTMKAIHNYEDGVDFPLEVLVFEEKRGDEEKSNSAFLALCPSCDRKYYADKSTDCPHCSDARPIFNFKK